VADIILINLDAIDWLWKRILKLGKGHLHHASLVDFDERAILDFSATQGI